MLTRRGAPRRHYWRRGAKVIMVIEGDHATRHDEGRGFTVVRFPRRTRRAGTHADCRVLGTPAWRRRARGRRRETRASRSCPKPDSAPVGWPTARGAAPAYT